MLIYIYSWIQIMVRIVANEKWWYSMSCLDPIMQNRRVMNNGILERTSMH